MNKYILHIQTKSITDMPISYAENEKSWRILGDEGLRGVRTNKILHMRLSM